MKPSRRKKLEKLALERLRAPANNVEQPWDYVLRENEPLGGWCPWNTYDDGGPADYGLPADLDLPWSEERRRQLESGEGEPNEPELGQWRREMCRWDARTKYEVMVLIKPMRMENDRVEAFEVWFDHWHNPEDPLSLFGVFDSPDEAKAALLTLGAVE